MWKGFHLIIQLIRLERSELGQRFFRVLLLST